MTCRRVTGRTIPALTLLLAPEPVPPRAALHLTSGSLESRRTQALSCVFPAGVRAALALLLALEAERPFRAPVGAGVPRQARRTDALAAVWVARGVVLTLTDLRAIVAVEPRGALKFTIAAVSPRPADATAAEPITGGVVVAGAVQLAVGAVVTSGTR